MTFLEYKMREGDIINSHRNGRITRDTMYKMLEDNRKAYNEWQEYRMYGMHSLHPPTAKESLERAEAAQKSMRERRNEIADTWTKAYAEDGKIKVRKGCAGLPLVDMTVLEARLLAAQILSLTNPKKKRS